MALPYPVHDIPPGVWGYCDLAATEQGDPVAAGVPQFVAIAGGSSSAGLLTKASFGYICWERHPTDAT